MTPQSRLPSALLLLPSLAWLLAGTAPAARAAPAPAPAEEPAGEKEKAFRFQMARARELAARAATTGDGATATEAVDAYMAAARLMPRDPVPLAEAALLALDFGDGASTARFLAGVHEVAPESGAFHFVKGALNLSRGEYRDAMAEFEAARKGEFKADQAEDRHFEAMLGHGFELVDFNRFDQALEVLREAVALKPTHPMVPRAYYHMALAYRRLQSIDDAEKILLLCIRQFPSFAVAYGELGDLYTELSRFDEALAILDRAVRVDPSYAQGYLLRAVAYTGKGMWEEARKAFGEFDRRFPPTGNSELQWGIFLQAAGEPEAGLKRLRSALARDPTQYRAHLIMSMCFHDLGMEEEAAAAKARWLEADEMVKRASHQKRLDAKARFGEETGPGEGVETPPPGEAPPGETPPDRPPAGEPGDGGHGDGGG